MEIRWLHIFLDTPRADAPRSWAFWSDVTGTTASPTRGEQAQFATLLPARGEAWLKVQAIDGPARVHLDVDTADRAGFVARATALGATVRGTYHDVSLHRPEHVAVRVLLQRRDDETPASAHVDFAVTDRATETDRHVRAGAEVVSVHSQWTVLRDPVGRSYCLTDRDPATGLPR